MGDESKKASPAASQRLRQLKTMLERQPDDPFLLYGVAMEHKKAGEPGLALEFFERALLRDPDYCYAYYQKAQVQESLGEVEAARRSLRDGLDAAARSDDGHARQEIEAALALLE